MVAAAKDDDCHGTRHRKATGIRSIDSPYGREGIRDRGNVHRRHEQMMKPDPGDLGFRGGASACLLHPPFISEVLSVVLERAAALNQSASIQLGSAW